MPKSELGLQKLFDDVEQNLKCRAHQIHLVINIQKYRLKILQ